MKKTKIVIPAMGLLLLGTAASVTGTVAWFSMNASVSVTGMQVKTKTSSNLFVQGIAYDATSLPSEAGFGPSLDQTASALLEPVSTVTASDDAFFYHNTQTVNTEGEITEDTAAYLDYDVTGVGAPSDSTNYTDAFSENYGVTKTDASAYGSKASAYVDNVFALKAVNAGAAAYVYLDYANLVYNGVGSRGVKSYRVAIFTDKWNGSAFAGRNLLSIITPTGATNFTDGKAVSAVDALNTVTYGTEAKFAVTANSTEYFRVTARLWLEGEDDTCNNETFMLLTSNWNLDFKFSLKTSGTGASAISLYDSASLSIGGVASTKVMYNGTNLYTYDEKANLVQLNSTASQIPSAKISADELTALNTAFGTSFARA